MQWLVTATTEDGRFSYHGFSEFGITRFMIGLQDDEGLFITDRPVYRPKQEVNFKAWFRHAQYDKTDDSQFAGQEFKIFINTPNG